MNISVLLDTRAKFTSRLESIDSLDILNEVSYSMSCTALEVVNDNGEPWGMNLKFQKLQQFFLYFLGVHALEPVFGEFNELKNLSKLSIDFEYSFDKFTRLTTVDLKKTFLFKPLKFTDDMLLAYQDFAYQGERSIYKPFGHTANTAIDTKITANIAEVKEFFLQHFKFANLKGKATFTMAEYLPKGTVIAISDRQLKLLITSVVLRDSGINYEALVVIKGD